MDNEMREMFGELFNMMKSMQADINSLKQDVSDLKQDVSDLKQDVSSLQSKTDKLQDDVNGLRGVLETETNHYIKVIAEGHEMETEKVNNYINAVETVRAKQEMFEIRLSMLESEVRQIKRV